MAVLSPLKVTSHSMVSKVKLMAYMKITLILTCVLCVNSAYALSEKAYIVFTAGLNEITTNKGSYAELASLLELQRKKQAATFFIFGGNSLFPSILSSFDHGTHIIDLLNSLEPDVMAASKGDFAFYEDELSLRTYEAAFPIVQSNIIEIASKQNLNGLLNSEIIQQGAYKLGFISLMDKTVIEDYNLTRIKIKNPRAVIAIEAQKLREKGAQFIILHYRGTELNSIDFLNEHLVDLVLRKNNRIKQSTANEQQKHPQQIFLTRKAQAAIIELNWQKNQPQTLTVQWQAKNLNAYPKSNSVQRQIESYTSQLNLLLDKIIGITTTDIDTSLLSLRTKENALGNLIADLMKKHSSAEIALINSGAIRGESFYPRNSKISRRDVVRMLPYRDTVVLLEISGKQLKNALENSFSQIKNMEGRFLQVSGIKVVYDSKAEIGRRVMSVSVNGSPLQLAKHYKLATSDYIANGGDGYLLFKQNKQFIYNQQMSKSFADILTNELRLTNSISPKIQSRIIDIAKK